MRRGIVVAALRSTTIAAVRSRVVALTSAFPIVLGVAGSTLAAAPAAAQDVPSLFADEAPLAVTIEADFAALRGDRADSPDRPALYRAGSDSSLVELEGEIRTRGRFRLDPANCSFPPLRIEISAREGRGTLLDGIDDTKLVSSCRPGRDSYDQLVILEYLAYRTYGLLTEASFRVRRLEVTFVDTSGEHEPETRSAFVIEEDEELAARLDSELFELEEGRNLNPAGVESRSQLTVSVFQYMIGNTDWSTVAGHNVELLSRGNAAHAVPYDFDSSGLVNAPYATFDPDLGIRTVRERKYRGYCVNAFLVGLVLDDFRARREETLALWAAEPGLDDTSRAEAIRYLESFYEDIETNDRAERRFLRDCRGQ